MLVLSPTMIAYIIDVISLQVRQRERENDAIPTVTKLYATPVESVSLPQSGYLNFECSMAPKTQLNI